MKIAVMGAGAIGGYFGGRLAKAGFDVSFIARGAHLAAIRENGLKVLSPLGDFTIHPELYPRFFIRFFFQISKNSSPPPSPLSDSKCVKTGFF